MPNVVDILAIVAIIIGLIQGYRRGLSGELGRLVGAIVVFLVGLMAYAPLGAWIAEHTRLNAQGAMALSFFILIILAIVVMIVTALLVRKIVRFVFAEEFDRLCGCIAGTLRMTVVVLIFFVLMNLVPHAYLNRLFGEQSMIGRLVLRAMPRITEIIDSSMDEEQEERTV